MSENASTKSFALPCAAPCSRSYLRIFRGARHCPNKRECNKLFSVMSGKLRSVKSTSRRSQSVFLQEVGQTSVANAGHVRPTIYLDAELPYVPEEAAAGISAYRKELESYLGDSTKHSLPHEEIITKLDESATTVRVLILKTNLRLPYTSVFLQLDCGYWSADAEARMRERMEAAASDN